MYVLAQYCKRRQDVHITFQIEDEIYFLLNVSYSCRTSVSAFTFLLVLVL